MLGFDETMITAQRQALGIAQGFLKSARQTVKSHDGLIPKS
jgi:hypothetical protein